MRNKRLEDFSSKAMQGILSSEPLGPYSFDDIAKMSVEAAKSLIKKIDEDGAKG